MSLSVCPAAIVAVPVEDVWELLAHPSRYDEWWDAHTTSIEPQGPATPGQTIYAQSRAFGREWKVVSKIEMVNPDSHQIQMRVTLPLGLVNLASVRCTPIDATSCRVQYG